MTDRPWSRQREWDVRFEWGPAGVEAVAADAAFVVVVDVMRFTTAVDAAVSRGATVFPFRWEDGAASAYAKQVGALLADPGDPMGPSLSPISLLALDPGDRIVLPSPNGSTCAALASGMGATVLAGCLRNASAIGRWLRGQGGSVAVIACGERWPDGSLRPSLEDHLGSGAIIAELGGRCSPEAAAAGAAWRSSAQQVDEVLSSCVSGKELLARGWSDDLAFALAVDASSSVPVLYDGFVDANT